MAGQKSKNKARKKRGCLVFTISIGAGFGRLLTREIRLKMADVVRTMSAIFGLLSGFDFHSFNHFGHFHLYDLFRLPVFNLHDTFPEVLFPDNDLRRYAY